MQKLKHEKQKQRQLFQAVVRPGNNATEATYKAAYILGKNRKPFSDVEIVKECIVEVVGCLDPDKVSKYKQLPLARRTITDLQHELALNVTEQLHTILQKEIYIIQSLWMNQLILLTQRRFYTSFGP